MQPYSSFFETLFASDFLSEYSHLNHIDKTGGKTFFHMDCSGFVYWGLAQMGYTRALVELRAFLREHDFIKLNRFFCKDFEFIFKYKDIFKYWKFMNQPATGAILVTVFHDGNGHCMFVDKIINTDEKGFVLRVLDSTNYPHKNDSRTNNGIGTGEIEIIKNNDLWVYDSGNKSLPPRPAEIYFVSTLK